MTSHYRTTDRSATTDRITTTTNSNKGSNNNAMPKITKNNNTTTLSKTIDNTVTLMVLVDRDPRTLAFPITVPLYESFEFLRYLIKNEICPKSSRETNPLKTRFSNLTVGAIFLWRVAIPNPPPPVQPPKPKPKPFNRNVYPGYHVIQQREEEEKWRKKKEKDSIELVILDEVVFKARLRVTNRVKDVFGDNQYPVEGMIHVVAECYY
ncbi:hypothetical protein BGW39_002422 [Mortierella sp. 14UC]|nr:hypothetical protein BGW39_002422 [Mortierella sp. 14UC]